MPKKKIIKKSFNLSKRRKKEVTSSDTWLEFGVDIPNRVLHMAVDIDDITMSLYSRAISTMVRQNSQPIDVIICTCGGDVYSALGFYDVLSTCGVEIRTHGQGKVMSAGCIIFLAGEERTALPLTTFMVHSVSYGPGDAKTFQHEVDLLESKRLNQIMLDLLDKRTKMRFNFWLKKTRTDDFYMDSIKAKEYGITT